MFLFQVATSQNLAQKQTALDAFKADVESAKKRLDSGEAPASVERWLNGKYNNALNLMSPNEIAIYTKDLNRSFNSFVNHIPESSADPTKKTDFYVESERTVSREVFQERLDKVASELQIRVFSTLKTSFYGNSRAAEKPWWVGESLKTDYDLLTSAFSSTTAEGRHAEAMAFLNSSVSYSYMTAEQKDVLATLLSLGNSTALDIALSSLTKTQKAIDGMSLAIAANKLDGYISDAQFKAYFPSTVGDINGYSDDEITELRVFCGLEKSSTPVSNEEIVNIVLRRASTPNSLESKNLAAGLSQLTTDLVAKLSNIAVEANFGENAGSLGPLVEEMSGKGSFSQGASAIENLKAFYLALLDDQTGLKSDKFQKALPGLKKTQISLHTIAGQTAPVSSFADWLITSNSFFGSSDSIGQMANDISTIAALMVARDKTAYLKSALFKDPNHVKAFMDAITPAASLPAVQLTLLANPEFLDFVFKNFRNKPDEMLRIIGEVSDYVERIYNLPSGTEFNSPEGVSLSKIATKHAAAAAFVAHILKLEGNWLLDDLRARFTDNRYQEDEQYFRIRALEEILALRGPDSDFNFLNRDLMSITKQPALWKDGNRRSQAIYEYVNHNPRFILQDIEREYIALGRVPENFIYGISRTYDRMMRQDLRSMTVEMSGTASGRLDTLADKEKGDVYDNTTLNIGGHAVTVPGGRVSGSYALDSRKDINDGVATTDWDKQQAILDAQNLYFGQSRIYNLLLNYIKDNSTTVGGDLTIAKTTDQNLIAQAKTYMAGTDTVLFLDWNAFDTVAKPAIPLTNEEAQVAISQMSEANRLEIQNMRNNMKTMISDETGTFHVEKDGEGNLIVSTYGPEATSEGNRTFADIVFYRDGGYFHVLGLDKHYKELAGLLSKELKGQQLVLEHSQWVGPIGTYAGIEVQNRKREGTDAFGNELEPLTPKTRYGMAIGVENGASTMAALFQKTALGGSVGVGSLKSKGTIYSAGYIKYEPQGEGYTNLMGEPSTIYNYGPMGRPTPESPLYFASHMSSKLYGIYMGNQEMAAMRLTGDPGESHVSAGGFLRWACDIEVRRFNGQYIYKDSFKVRNFYDYRMEKLKDAEGNYILDENGNVSSKTYELWGGRTIIPLSGKNEVNLHLYGLNQIIYKNTLTRSPTQLDNWIANVQALSDEIATQLDNSTGTSVWELTEDGRASKVRSWTETLRNLLNEAQFLLPANAFNEVQNQFAIGIEWRNPKTGNMELTKFSYSRLAPGGEAGSYGYEGKGDTYLLNITSLDLGTKAMVTFTAGVKTEKEEGSANPNNVVGIKFDLGNVAFGMTGYNVLDSGKRMRFDMGYVNPNYSGKFLGLERFGTSVTAMEGGGMVYDVGVGNNRFFVSATREHSADAVANSLAAQFSLYNAVSSSASFGVAYRPGSINELGISEYELYGSVSGKTWGAGARIT